MITARRNRVNDRASFPKGNTLYIYRSKKHIAPLYNGISNDQNRRFKEHQKSKEWFKKADTVYTVNGFKSRENLLRAEERTIKHGKPIHNKQHNGDRSKSESFWVNEHPELLVAAILLVAIVATLAAFAFILWATYKIIHAVITKGISTCSKARKYIAIRSAQLPCRPYGMRAMISDITKRHSSKTESTP